MEKPEIHLFRYHPGGRFAQGESRLFVKNSDPWAYEFQIHVDVDNRYCWLQIPDGTLTIKPNSSLPLYVKCEESLFRWFATGFLKSDTRPAQVPIKVLVPGTGRELATRRVPISAVLSYYPDWFQPYANGFWSIGILIVGALLSVFVTIVLPNYGRRVELTRRLAPVELALQRPGALLAAENSLLSTDHERARLLLKLEWRRLNDILKTISPVSMNAGTMLGEVQAKTAVLEKKVALFRRVDASLSATVDLNAGHLPPSVLDRVYLHCATGVAVLRRDSITEKEWDQITGLVAESEHLLADTGERLDWLEKSIADVEAAVQKALCDADRKLREPIPKLWGYLCSDVLKVVPEMAEAPFFPSQYAARDRRAILFSYVQRYVALQSLPAGAGGEHPLNPMKERFEGICRRRPFDLLGARRLIEQLESGVSPEDLVQEIRQKKVEICPRETTLPCFSPIRLQVIFPHTPRFNTVPAKRQIGVHWNYGDGSEADGWEVWHYFAKRKEPYRISVQFLDKTGTGQPISDGKEPIEIQAIARAERQPAHLVNQSKGVDILRFVLAVLTAAFALSGVRQILPTGDAFSATVGALALGFTADTFKNLLTSRK